ncbi:MAG TPA: 5-(carboxyamino)imidazole ribonucleotide synthase [Streptosporangiaceae bacterium]|nr:5-(carboxyamino)imidazole ribonucleotide synthase [Streptosporangiaceae bacterium]
MTDSAEPTALAPAPPVVGMVGGGQLARMTSQAATGLGIGFRVLAGTATDSAAQVVAGTTLGDYRSLASLRDFAAGCDVLTFDHEHVPGPLLAALEQDGIAVRPGAAALRFTQDKLAMRERLTGMGIACPRYAPVHTATDVEAFADGTWPLVLKAVSGGYDGRGVWFCESASEAGAVLASAGLAHGALLAEVGGLMAEEYVAFDRELAVLAARSPHRQGAVYPVVQTVQRDGICREVIAPAPGLAPGRRAQAQELALRIAKELGVTGLLAVEMFETPAGLLVNELAMRPHNTGHWTIEGARTSQFEQHLRAVLDLPLGSPAMAAPAAAMANVLGGDDADVYDRYIHVMAADPAVKVHMYGKQVRPGRKIGHVTAVGEDPEDLADRARRAASYLRWGKEDGE